MYRESEGNMILRNVLDFVPDCTESQLVRDFFSFTTTIFSNVPNKHLHFALLMRLLVMDVFYTWREIRIV